MPVALAEWRVRIGRFVRRKPVQVDFEKIIETVLERRKQILQKIDDLLENTRKNAAKQEAESKCAKNPGPSTVSESRNEDDPTTLSTSLPDCNISDRKSDDQCPLASTESRDAGPPASLKPGDCDIPPVMTSSSSSSSSPVSRGQDRQCSEDVRPQPNQQGDDDIPAPLVIPSSSSTSTVPGGKERQCTKDVSNL